MVTLLALVGLVAAPAPVACACSCRVTTTAEALAESSAVFSGEVVASATPSTGSSVEPVRYLIRADRVYKGDLPVLVTVSSAAHEDSCGLVLAGKVTVFARGPVLALRTDLCAAPVTVDRAVLGNGVAPTRGPEDSGPLPSPAPAPAPHTVLNPLVPGIATVAVLLAAAAAAAAAGAWLVLGRRR